MEYLDLLYQRLNNSAVRFGRVPKREKAKILAAMQKVNQNSQEKHLNEQLEDESKLLISILQAHEETCDYTSDKVAALIDKARKQPVYARCPLQMACPLNPLPQNCMENGEANGLLEDFSERFSPAIRGVVEFAKRIPGFGMLSQDDQVTLLKAGVFEVLLVRLACMFDMQTNSMICLNGMVLKRESLHSQSSARFLLDSMFGFAEMLNALNLSDHEIALFCAVVVISPDRPGLRNTDLVQKIHRKLDDLLQKAIVSNHSDNPGLFADLKKKIPDLRTLNTLHAEKLLAYKMGPNSGQSCVNGNGTISSHGDRNTSSPQSMCSYASLLPVQWQQFTLNDSNNACNKNLLRESSSPNGLKSNWNDLKDGCEAKFDSPRCFGNNVSSTNNLFNNKSPPRSASASSAKSNGYNSDIGSYSPSDQVNNYILGKRLLSPLQQNSRMSNINGLNNIVASSNGSMKPKCEDRNSVCNDESYFSAESSLKKAISGTSDANFNKLRRVDSPTDSGIESGKEQCNGSTPTTSVCSSPRSAMDDKVKDIISYTEGCEKQETIDDMPMLKRALQAPPLINTNMLMDEAYRHHKKFRATKRESEPGSTSSIVVKSASPPSPPPPPAAAATTTATSSIISKSSSCASDTLASTHSTLVKVLEQAPRYIDDHHHHHHQLKRSDLSHNIIMKSEPMPPPLDLSRKRDLLFL